MNIISILNENFENENVGCMISRETSMDLTYRSPAHLHSLKAKLNSIIVQEMYLGPAQGFILVSDIV